MMDRFVNPYAFVSLPQEVVRKSPTMHCGQPPTGKASELLSGRILVRWTLETPLLLPAAYRQEKWVDDSGRIRIPGSSVRGVTRSLHESLFCGCLRIVDEKFVPSYRMTAREGTERDWRLARVSSCDDGKACTVQLCDDEVWVDARELLRKWPSGSRPTSGDIVNVDGPVVETPLGRGEIRQVYSVDVHSRAEAQLEGRPATAEGQLLLVTSTSARKKYRDNGSVCDAYWALGTLNDVDPIRVAATAVENFTIDCAGSDDRRRLERPKQGERPDPRWRTHTTYEDVQWWDTEGKAKPPVGRRAKASGYLFTGDAVWVLLNDEGTEVVGIRLAQIWRHHHPDTWSVARRLGARSDTSPHPCAPTSDKPELCLSCATFGAIDHEGERRGHGEQTAYRGHVRFSSAQSTDAVTLRQVELTPMGTPNPGSGMFYLNLPATVSSDRNIGDVATQWGSQADDHAAINGRKFYWHADPDKQAAHLSETLKRRIPPRYEANDDQRKSRMTRQASLVHAGTVLEATVTFDRLDEVALRALLASLDPTAMLHFVTGKTDTEYAVHLGGGKPLGLGSARPEIVELDIQRLGERYLGHDAAATRTTDWQGVGRDEAGMFFNRVGKLFPTARTVAHLLDINALGEWEALVSYPPGAGWDEVDGRDFRHSFGFFVSANGQVLATRVQPWHVLPRPAPGANPSLPIETRRAGRR